MHTFFEHFCYNFGCSPSKMPIKIFMKNRDLQNGFQRGDSEKRSSHRKREVCMETIYEVFGLNEKRNLQKRISMA